MNFLLLLFYPKALVKGVKEIIYAISKNKLVTNGLFSLTFLDQSFQNWIKIKRNLEKMIISLNLFCTRNLRKAVYIK